MAQSKDLFDDSTMTFGEHLECLRTHLIRAIIGLAICVIGALFIGDRIVAIVRSPIDLALRKAAEGEGGSKIKVEDDIADVTMTDVWQWIQEGVGLAEPAENSETDGENPDSPVQTFSSIDTGNTFDRTIEISVMPSELAKALHKYNPDGYPAAKPASSDVVEKPFTIRIAAPEFQQLEAVIERQSQAVTLNVQEAFMTYIKVAFIAGLLIASPWVFREIWLFVAAGLYPHERKYVYLYLPMSLTLFTGGAVFCFYAVFPFVLKFLLGFNKLLEVQPQIRLSEWINFAVMLPVMFGVSFQLPLVMLFLERISVFEIVDYREKRRMAILVIAFLSMILTPADPMSMLLMMFPLILLYELGIILCGFNPHKPQVEGLEPV
ncbi:MAG: twin-arginine translocase subunit TatC [Planctomycetaceae bacterium]|jgi:sec-independent protein translocase protein TatC|nr:twin-arginine translocase subunit TatC [Planctomycetaceae bacterium]